MQSREKWRQNDQVKRRPAQWRRCTWEVWKSRGLRPTEVSTPARRNAMEPISHDQSSSHSPLSLPKVRQFGDALLEWHDVIPYRSRCEAFGSLITERPNSSTPLSLKIANLFVNFWWYGEHLLPETKNLFAGSRPRISELFIKACFHETSTSLTLVEYWATYRLRQRRSSLHSCLNSRQT